jgi:TROVE domain
MSKFNTPATRTAAHGPLATEAQPSGKTHEGGTGYARDAKSELFLRTTASFAGEDNFYEQAQVRDDRARALTEHLAVDGDGFAWLSKFLPWLRSEGNIRTAPIMLATEAVRARLLHGDNGGGNRQLIASVLQRPDEPGEMLAYWTSRYGKAIPKPIKRGIADAVARLYTERAFLRYDSEARGFRFGDVVELCHPAGRQGDFWQGKLFTHMITSRHSRNGYEPPQDLAAVRTRWALSRLSPEERHQLAKTALGDSSLTARENAEKRINLAAQGQWEFVLAWLGETPPQGALTKAEQWQLVLPQLGFMAALRNLRNLDEAGISDELAASLAARIADPEQVKHSRQLPFRFLSAYLNAPSLRWGHALEKALDLSLANIPELPGRTLILIDTSASMTQAMSGRSKATMVQSAALFGLALGIRNINRVDMWGFADGQFQVSGIGQGASVLRSVEAFCRCIGNVGHGTQISAAVRNTYRNHDRVIIFTDMQTFPENQVYDYYIGKVYDHSRYDYQVSGVSATVPAHIPMYGFNLVGYTHSAIPAGHGNRHEMGGLTDATFKFLPLIEAGKNAAWPWE